MRRSAGIVLIAAGIVLGRADDRASFSCNAIPGTTNAFRGTLGTADRPFAGPGDWVDLSLDACASSSPGFAPREDQNVVTVVFTPPGGGPRSVVVVAADCEAPEVQPLLDSCGLTAGTQPRCVSANAGRVATLRARCQLLEARAMVVR